MTGLEIQVAIVLYLIITVYVWFKYGRGLLWPITFAGYLVGTFFLFNSNTKLDFPMKLVELRENAEKSAMYVSIAYRIIYVLTAVGLFLSKSFWPVTIGFLLGAIGLEVIEHVGSIISWYLAYRSLRKKGIKDDDIIEKPSFANTIYWVCWILKVLCTVGVIVSIGFELFKLIS